MAIRIRDVIGKLTEEGGALGEESVDRLETGNFLGEVEAIATAFMASQQVLERAVALGVNLLITHEGLFYSHRPGKQPAANDPVVRQKRRLIEESGIAVYRFHDGIHRYEPDGIMAGFVEEAGWEAYVKEYQPAAAILELPPTPLADIVQHLRTKLEAPFVRFVGDARTVCSRVGLLVGYRGGGELAIPLFAERGVDLVVAGEGPEWETPEYVRDAVHQGLNRALLVLGHGPSEAPGMKYLAKRLQAAFPSVPVHFLADQPLFQIIG
ncbi:MAG: Nif3-like dinuclear metal center hexameric protein [Paenibacillus macerans]|uniref:Nif3-like dinuclear metal center hexameric protein n=1 Tax=Paenibacillus macerans TaxID=44252 RepID=UPI00242ECBC8|nr:Nif3-like dinuclear metal center hexameric protein [Paenibacillus macerans]MBS5914147.1 Nif3-like dinuclear metal center hexameric protein [Paenibacillus macerans]